MKRLGGTITKVSTTIVGSKSYFRIGLYPCEECFLSLLQILLFFTPRFKSALSKCLSKGEGKRPWFLSLDLVNSIEVEGFLLFTVHQTGKLWWGQWTGQFAEELSQWDQQQPPRQHLQSQILGSPCLVSRVFPQARHSGQLFYLQFFTVISSL
ncbi:hypothetical protein PIB30_079836 [Stylosanthes scabra]|uniref:Uncharacterized protein n=1 Tax=Stylosanthes scabra TaxID=79078 RepID=A0ABU6ST84_9FABA|nr:hypothetical protein [Stylosanthes scabra]